MMKSKNPFMGALPIVAKAIGRQYGVIVIIGGSGAYTDGKRINLPSLPMEGGPHLETLLGGYLDHEAAHCRFTDFSAQRGPSKFHNWVENALEDIRIETLMGRAYPGCKINLAKLNQQLVDDGEITEPADDAGAVEVLTCRILHGMRHDVLGQTAVGNIADKAKRMMSNFFSQELIHDLDGLLAQAPSMTSTSDAIDLAAQIVDLVREEQTNDEQQQQQSGDGESDQNGDADEQSSDDSSGSDSDDNNDSDSDSSNESGSDNDEESDSDGESGEAGQPSDDEDSESESGGSESSNENDPDEETDGNAASDEQEEADDTASSDASGEESDDEDSGNNTGEADPQDSDESGKSSTNDETVPEGGRGAARDVLNADDELPEDQAEILARQLADESPYGGYDDPNDVDIPEASDMAREDSSSPSRGVEPVDLSKVKPATAKLRTRLAGLIEAQRKTHKKLCRNGRRLNNRRLPKVQMGDPHPFYRKQRGAAVNTAVTVLLDRSDSMGGHKMTIAREASLALTMALEEIQGVNASAFAFPGCSMPGIGDNHSTVETLHRREHRVNPEAFGITASGGTPLGEAAWFAGWDLMQAPEPRKILLTVTDGAPNEPNKAISVLNRLRSSQVETIGIGIAGHVIRPELFPENISVQDVRELASSLFSIMERKLVTAA